MFDTEVENMFQQFIRVKPLCLQWAILLKVKFSTGQPCKFIVSNYHGYVIKS